MKISVEELSVVVRGIVSEAMSDRARKAAGRKGGEANVVMRDYEPKSEADELEEKEYKAIKGTAKYKKGKGGFDLKKCIDDLGGVDTIDNPAAVCRSAEIVQTGKAKATRGPKARD